MMTRSWGEREAAGSSSLPSATDTHILPRVRPVTANRGGVAPLPGSSSDATSTADGSGSPSVSTVPGIFAAAIIHHQSYPDLHRCLESLHAQTLPPLAVLVIDADAEPVEHQRMAKRWSEVVWRPSPNLGYAGGANRALRILEGITPSAEFFLLLNPDVALDADFAETLLTEMGRHPRAALGSGKLLRPGRTTLDSAGITLPRHRRPRDRGSGERDRGQYQRTEYLFGASGAALMIRKNALASLAVDGEIFDEDFFVYHEDTDLSWRANRLGWRVLYAPRATAVHTRHWRRDRRREIPVWVRRHSFKNHYLQLLKNETVSGFLKNLPYLVAWECLRLGFALLRDREILPGYGQAWRRRRSALRKRRRIRERAREASRALSPAASAPSPRSPAG